MDLNHRVTKKYYEPFKFKMTCDHCGKEGVLNGDVCQEIENVVKGLGVFDEELIKEEQIKAWSDICADCKFNRTHWVHAKANRGLEYGHEMPVLGHEFVEKTVGERASRQ